jgi:hypothetical protein
MTKHLKRLLLSSDASIELENKFEVLHFSVENQLHLKELDGLFTNFLGMEEHI